MSTLMRRDRLTALPLSALLAWSSACGGSSPAQTPAQAGEEATPATPAPSPEAASLEAASPKEPATEDTSADAALPLLREAAPPIVLGGTQGPYDLERASAEGPSFVITREGKVAYAYVGDNPVDRPTVDDLIEQVQRAAAGPDATDPAAP